MDAKTAWENIKKATQTYRGTGPEWAAIFQSMSTIEDLVEKAMAEHKDVNTERAKDGP